jgi:hypothetical protein
MPLQPPNLAAPAPAPRDSNYSISLASNLSLAIEHDSLLVQGTANSQRGAMFARLDTPSTDTNLQMAGPVQLRKAGRAALARRVRS